MNPLLVLDVVRFELSRSLTFGRTVIWFVLVIFPIALVATLRLIDAPDDPESAGMRLYF